MWFFRGKWSSGFSNHSTAEEFTQGIYGSCLTAIVTGPLILIFILVRFLWCNKEKRNKMMCFFGGKGPSGFSSYSTAEEVTQGIDGSGLTAIVTGACSGIGMETARVLVMRGVHVVMAVIDLEVGRKVKDNILEKVAAAKIDVLAIDLSSLDSVRKFALEFKSLNLPLNILINNAGVLLSQFKLSKDGIELHFAINYLGHFLLTNLLLENMKTTASQSQVEGRIINVSSMGHQYVHREGILFDQINDDTGFKYGQSKLANILHTSELARRLKEERVNVIANSLHPGSVIGTNIYLQHSFLKLFHVFHPIVKHLAKNVEQGAATTCYVALHPQVKGANGEYFADSNISKASSLAGNRELGKKLWDFSSSLINSSQIKGVDFSQH